MSENSVEIPYVVKAVCCNCEWQGEVAIPKGIRVDEQPCPMCGCAALVVDPVH